MIIRINVPDGDEADFRAVFAADYSTTLPDGSANPLNRNQHAKEAVRNIVRDAIYQHRMAQRPPVELPTITVD